MEPRIGQHNQSRQKLSANRGGVSTRKLPPPRNLNSTPLAIRFLQRLVVPHQLSEKRNAALPSLQPSFPDTGTAIPPGSISRIGRCPCRADRATASVCCRRRGQDGPG